jgi:hypothetical protein
MAINQNHLFEELNGIKCAIVEKNASVERVEFLKAILENNHFTVVVTDSPAPKTAAKQAASGTEVPPALPDTPATGSYTIGVTDVMFNPTNAIFGRLLKTPDGHVVTLAYWQQKATISNDAQPYFE